MKLKVVKYTEMDKAVLSATRSMINKVIKKANTEASRAVRRIYNIKAKDLKKYTYLYKATNNKLHAEVRIYKNRLPLDLFQPTTRIKRVPAKSQRWRGKRLKRKIVSVRVKKTTGRKIVKGAFVHNGKIYKRIGNKRFPIRRLSTIGPARMYWKEGLRVMERIANENAGRIMANELKYYSEKYAKRMK